MKVRQDAWTEENDLLLAETVLRHVREGSTQLNAFEEVGDKLNRTSAACGFRWNAVVRHQYEKALELAKKQRKQRQRILGKDQGGKKKLLYQPPVVTVGTVGTIDPVTAANPIETVITSGPIGNMTASSPVSHVTVSGPSTDSAGMADTESMNEEMASEISIISALTSESDAGNHKGTISLDSVIAYLQNLNHSNLHVEILKSENERLKRELADLKRENQELHGKINHLEQNTETIQEDYETLMKIMNRARKLVLFEEEDRPQTTFKMDRNGNLEKVAE